MTTVPTALRSAAALLALSASAAGAQQLPDPAVLRAEAEAALGGTLEDVAGPARPAPVYSGPMFPGADVLGRTVFSVPVGGAAMSRAVHAEVRNDVLIILPPQWRVVQAFVGDTGRWRVTTSDSFLIIQPGERGAQTNLTLVLTTGDILQFDLIEVSPYTRIARTGRVYVGPEDWLLDRVFSLLPAGLGRAVLDSGVSVPDLLEDPARVVYSYLYDRPGGLGSPGSGPSFSPIYDPPPVSVPLPAPTPVQDSEPEPEPEPDPAPVETLDAGPPVPADLGASEPVEDPDPSPGPGAAAPESPLPDEPPVPDPGADMPPQAAGSSAAVPRAVAYFGPSVPPGSAPASPGPPVGGARSAPSAGPAAPADVDLYAAASYGPSPVSVSVPALTAPRVPDRAADSSFPKFFPIKIFPFRSSAFRLTDRFPLRLRFPRSSPTSLRGPNFRR